MYERLHHQRIHRLLSAMDAAYLVESDCFFAGGTAIALSLGEYRESVDVDFLCASATGYRAMRNTINLHTLGRLFVEPMKLAREVRADRYGIRTFIDIDGTPVKFEIIREDRIALQSDGDCVAGVPLLSRVDLYAEKLLANADRYLDKSQSSRDIIDLAMMTLRWGPIPTSAWAKAREAYGDSVSRAHEGAVTLLLEQPDHLRSCLKTMGMSLALADDITGVLRASGSSAPPG